MQKSLTHKLPSSGVCGGTERKQGLQVSGGKKGQRKPDSCYFPPSYSPVLSLPFHHFRQFSNAFPLIASSGAGAHPSRLKAIEGLQGVACSSKRNINNRQTATPTANTEPTQNTGEHGNSIKHLAPRVFKPGTLMRATAVTPSVIVLYCAVGNLGVYMLKGQVEMLTSWSIPKAKPLVQTFSTRYPLSSPTYPRQAKHCPPAAEYVGRFSLRAHQRIDLFSCTQSSIFISFLSFFHLSAELSAKCLPERSQNKHDISFLLTLEEQVVPHHMTLTFYYIFFLKPSCFQTFLIVLCFPKDKNNNIIWTFFLSSKPYVAQIVFLAMLATC